MSYEVPGLDWSNRRIIPAFQLMAHLDVYDLRGASREALIAATTIAGIVNRPQPRVYLITGSDDEYWLNQLFHTCEQTLSSHSGNDALYTLLDKYQHCLKGLIIYDPELLDTLNVATTMAGQQDGIVVSPDLAQQLLEVYHFPTLSDLRKFAWKSRAQVYHWAIANLLEGSSARLIAGLDPQAFCGLRSFLVATRTFVYWLDTSKYLPDLNDLLISERALAQQLYRKFSGAAHLGWFVNEPGGVALASQAEMIVLASDFFLNLEVWTALQASPTISSPPYDTPQVSDKVYLSFTLSDGDNLQYCQHHLRGLWSDSARGTLPIGWTLSPVLLEAAPALVNYYLHSATPQDEFIAGPSGAGYLFPSCSPQASLTPFLYKTGELMQSLGMTTLEVLDADVLYRSGLPLVSKISLSGMGFTDKPLQDQFVKTLAPYGVRGILSGAGFVLRGPGWRKIDNTVIYQNVGLADSVEHTIWLIKAFSSLLRQRPLFLNVYVIAWSMGPSALQQVVQQLGETYKVVLPRTLLAMLERYL